MKDENTPFQAAAFRDQETGTAQILCPICGRVHHHGQGDGHRLGHCGDLIPLEDSAAGYDLVTVPGTLPPEALEIDAAVKRLYSILYYRRSSWGWDSKRWKPSTAEVLDRWENLKAEARALNAQALKNKQEGNYGIQTIPKN